MYCKGSVTFVFPRYQTRWTSSRIPAGYAPPSYASCLTPACLRVYPGSCCTLIRLVGSVEPYIADFQPLETCCLRNGKFDLECSSLGFPASDSRRSEEQPQIISSQSTSCFREVVHAFLTSFFADRIFDSWAREVCVSRDENGRLTIRNTPPVYPYFCLSFFRETQPRVVDFAPTAP